LEKTANESLANLTGEKNGALESLTRPQPDGNKNIENNIAFIVNVQDQAKTEFISIMLFCIGLLNF